MYESEELDDARDADSDALADMDVSFSLTDEATTGEDNIENLMVDSDKDTMKVIDEQSDFKRFKL